MWRLGGHRGALILAVGVFYSWWVALFIVALIGCIFLHELGHYLTARSAGMKVTEFFLGFGPKICRPPEGRDRVRRQGHPRRRLRAHHRHEQPRRGRTRRRGPHLPPEGLLAPHVGGRGRLGHALRHRPRAALRDRSPAFGVPRANAWSVASLSPASPATQAGLALGDRVLAIDGQPVGTFGELTTIVRTKPGETVTLTVKKADGETVDVTTTLAGGQPDHGRERGLPRHRRDPRLREGLGARRRARRGAGVRHAWRGSRWPASGRSSAPTASATT